MIQADDAEAPHEVPKDAAASVAAQNAAMLNALPFADTADFDDAACGFLGSIDHAKVVSAQGRVIWSLEPYSFLSENEAPATVNPSLWRQSHLNMQHGLFKVVPGVYQVRGLDIANMTLIEDDSGVIVVDTLTSIEGARAAMELYFKHRGSKPVCSWSMPSRKTLSRGRRCCAARNINSDCSWPRVRADRSIAVSANRWRRARSRCCARPISSWRPATSGPSMGWNSNSRWRRIAKRPRRCIFTCRATGF
jgi:hypothetical protein